MRGSGFLDGATLRMADTCPLHEYSTVKGPTDFRITSSLFSAMVAVMIAAAYLALRIGFHDLDLAPVLKSLALSLFILLFPEVYGLWQHARGKESARSCFSSGAGLSLLGLLIAVLAGLATPYLPFDIAPAFYLCGPAFLVAAAVSWWRGGTCRENLRFLGIAAFFAIWCGAVVFGQNYHDPLFVEGIIVGRAHMDELVAVAATSMIKTYGVPSTGLDGVPYYGQYHWGSWWILAQLSQLVSVSAVKFVQAGYPIVFIPCLLNALLRFAGDVRERLPQHANAALLRNELYFWLLLCAAFVGFVPRAVDYFMNLTLSPSESYGVSLYLFFLVLSLGLRLADHAGPGRKRLRVNDRVFMVVILPVLLAIVCLTKVSTGFLLAVAGGYLFLRLRLYRNVWFSLSFIACAAAAALTISHVMTLPHLASAGTPIHLFHFLITHVPPWLQPFFFPVHYFWAGVFILGSLYARRIRSIGLVQKAVASETTLDLEVLIVVCVVGAAPGLTLAIGGGSAAYFSHVQAWLAVGLLLGNLSVLGNVKAPSSAVDAGAATGHPSAKRFLTYGLVALVVAGLLVNATRACMYTAYRNISIRLCLCNAERVASNREIGCGGKQWLADVLADVRAALTRRDGPSLGQVVREEVFKPFTKVQQGLERSNRYPLISSLMALNALSRAEKRETLVFIPQIDASYWELIDPNVTGALGFPACEHVPFIAPALTGMAMIDGLPPPDCSLYVFGYYLYQPRTSPQTEADTQEETLCEKARAKGFARLIVVDQEESHGIRMKRVSCTEE